MRLQRIAGRIERIGVGLSAALGGVVGLSFAYGAALSWPFTVGGFLSLLWVGMAVVVLSAISERVATGDWRAGLRLSCQVFLSQTTVYGLAVLTLALTPITAARMPIPHLAMTMLPGLYLCSVIAILGSWPLYLAWLPVRHDR